MTERLIEPMTPRGGIVYLASPYTNHPEGRAEAFVRTRQLAQILLLRGVVVYSPVVHGHPLGGVVKQDGDHMGTVPMTSEFWLAHCRPFLDAANHMLVFMDEGWKESRGVTYEIGYMHARRRPVVGVDARGWHCELKL